MRNIGGSFGIAAMTTFLARRGQVHQIQLITHVTPYDHRTQMSLHGMQAWFQSHGTNSVDAAKKSLGAIYGMVQQQAALLSFVEAFWIMGVIFLGTLPLVFVLRNARDLHPDETKPKASRQNGKQGTPAESEPELIGAYH
jgi:DHA2 family multidrug resistance protein